MGNYGAAAFLVATAIPVAGVALKVGKAALAGVKAARAAKTSNLALGLGDDLFKFADNYGFDTYRNFSSGFQQNKILDAINSYDKIHFSTSGFSKYRFSKFDPDGPLLYRNFTNWEMHTIFKDPSLLNKTTFYRTTPGGVYKAIDNYSPYF